MSSENPYESPHTSSTGEESEKAQLPGAGLGLGDEPVEDLYLASRFARFVNGVIDQLLVYLLSILVIAGISYAADLSTMGDLEMFLVGLVLYFLYFVPQEAVLGRTIGKFITRTRVVNAEGETPSLEQILGRTASRLIPFEAFSFLFKPYPVGVHDGLSKTRVVSN